MIRARDGVRNQLRSEAPPANAPEIDWSDVKNYDLLQYSALSNAKPGTNPRYFTVGGFPLRRGWGRGFLNVVKATPIFDKPLAEGSIDFWELDVQVLDTVGPQAVFFVYGGSGPDFIDKVQAAMGERRNKEPSLNDALFSDVNMRCLHDDLYEMIQTESK